MRLRSIVRLAAALLLLFAAAPVAAKPNIIVILADDLGLGDVGVYGARDIRTPHLDRMAREGARLTRFHASANVCTPSRAGLLTGRYPARSGLAHGVIYPHSTHGLPESETTLPEMLRDAGYRTAMLGKWHLGSTDAAWPTRHGFDAFWGVPWSNDMNPLPLYRDRTIVEEPLTQETFAERLVDEARAIIAAPSDKPFFLYVAHIAPHVPLRPGPRFQGRSAAGVYGDFVEEMDWTTGEILAALKKAGKDRDTIVLFTSDNGPWWEGSSGDRRGRKGDTFEGGYAVPLLARWPGAIPRGLVSDQMAMNIDLLPTLAAVSGASLPTDRAIDGRNILPLLTRRGAPTPHESLLFFLNGDIAAIRTQDWRMVVRAWYLNFNAPLEQFGLRLLFDMRRDPGETVNLAERRPDVLSRMRAMLEEARAVFKDMPQTRTDPFAKGPAQLPGGPREPAPAAR
jgi:uncharacterized sulfatase